MSNKISEKFKNLVDSEINDLVESHLESWATRYSEYEDTEKVVYDLNVNHDFSCEFENIAEKMNYKNYELSSKEQDYLIDKFVERVKEVFEPNVIEKSIYLSGANMDLEFSKLHDFSDIKDNLNILAEKFKQHIIVTLNNSEIGKYFKNETIRNNFISALTEVCVRQFVFDLNDKVFENEIETSKLFDEFLNEFSEKIDFSVQNPVDINQSCEIIDLNPDFLNIIQKVQLDFDYNDMLPLIDNDLLSTPKINIVLFLASNEISENKFLENRAIHLNTVEEYVEHTDSEISRIQARNLDCFVKQLDTKDKNSLADYYLDNLKNNGVDLMGDGNNKVEVLNKHFPSFASVVIDKFNEQKIDLENENKDYEETDLNSNKLKSGYRDIDMSGI